MDNQCKRWVAIASASIFLLAAGSRSEASTVGYYAITNIGPTVCDGTVSLNLAGAASDCTRSNVGVGPDTTNNVVLQSRAEAGSIGARSQLISNGPTSTPSLTSRAGIRDTLTFGTETGILELTLDIAGDLNFGPILSGTSSLDVFVTLSSSAEGGEVFRRSQRLNTGIGSVETLFATGDFGVSTVSLPFTDGSMFFAADIRTDVECFVTLIGGPCDAGANFFSSLRLIGAQVFDTDGTENFDPISSTLGFDYREGVEPHNSDNPAVIPLPAAGWLLLSGLGALMMARRLNRISSCT